MTTSNGEATNGTAKRRKPAAKKTKAVAEPVVKTLDEPFRRLVENLRVEFVLAVFVEHSALLLHVLIATPAVHERDRKVLLDHGQR